MKKLLISAATLALTVVPAAAASADSTSIAATQNQGYSTGGSSSSGDNSSLEQYNNSAVSYKAVYTVDYSASETNYLKAMTSNWDNEDWSADAHDDYTSHFNNMMNGWTGGQSGSYMGSPHHEQ